MNAPVKNIQSDRLDSSPSRGQQQTLRQQGGSLQFDARVTDLRAIYEEKADQGRADIVRGDVKTGREFVRGWDNNVSDNTNSRYINAVNNMRENNKLPENANSKATFEFNRAALVHVTRSELKGALRDFDKYKRQGDLTKAAQSYLKIRECNAVLNKYPPSTGNRADDLKRSSLYHGNIKSENSNCKRDSINNLPGDWKDKVQLQINETDKAAAGVMSLTGCRPAESKGVKVRQSEDKSTISIEIKGAKVDQDRGIKSRIVEFERAELEETQAGRDLINWLGDRQCRTTTYPGTLSSFRERVNSAFARAECSQGSCYSFRHSKATEMREIGASPSEIAHQLGQRSQTSQSVYGR